MQSGNEPRFLLIQPVGQHETDQLEKEYRLICETCGHDDIILAALAVDNWNDELSPWPAPPVFGDTPFGDGAARTLELITAHIIPYFDEKFPDSRLKRIIGGYSLAGLFSLWASYVCDEFAATAAASPSVWFEGWEDFMAGHYIRSRFVYLSLGDKEHRTKNPVLQRSREMIEKTAEYIDEDHLILDNKLEINPGNHFFEAAERTAKGFSWTVSQLEGMRLYKGSKFD